MMIHSLCLAAFSFLAFPQSDHPDDLSRFAPSESALLIGVDSREFDSRKLHSLIAALAKDPLGLPALLGPRGASRLQAALAFTKAWPDLPVGRSIDKLAHGGLLFGQAVPPAAGAKGAADSGVFVMIRFGSEDDATAAAEVLRTWLSLAKLFGAAGGQKIVDSMEQAGSRIVIARSDRGPD